MYFTCIWSFKYKLLNELIYIVKILEPFWKNEWMTLYHMSEVIYKLLQRITASFPPLPTPPFLVNLNIWNESLYLSEYG